MSDAQRYVELVHRLAALGYAVAPHLSGYVVQSQSDPDDRSYARHLGDLADLAELMEWREQYIVRQQQGSEGDAFS